MNLLHGTSVMISRNIKPPVVENPYLTFYSTGSEFTLRINNQRKNWDGTLEWSTDTTTWTEWDGTTTLSSINGYLYVRGTGNTFITGSNGMNARWIISGVAAACYGNIETLLDYSEVLNSVHPYMATGCYRYMFYNGSISAISDLPAITLSDSCYEYMFSGCDNVAEISADALPATTLAPNCYRGMFSRCLYLTESPKLPATQLDIYCYAAMFSQCQRLSTAPQLPATMMAVGCYGDMFSYCVGLISPPELPATTMANTCYTNMFFSCTSLTTAPELPATTLASRCYETMLAGCTSLTVPPELPATTLKNECYNRMFYGCTDLITPPELPATTLADACYGRMFYGCTSLISAPELPATTLPGGCYYGMFYGCTGLHLSSVTTSEYSYQYRIPTSGTGTSETNSLNDMFTNTGGTFTGTPTINTTYYTNHEPI